MTEDYSGTIVAACDVHDHIVKARKRTMTDEVVRELLSYARDNAERLYYVRCLQTEERTYWRDYNLRAFYPS